MVFWSCGGCWAAREEKSSPAPTVLVCRGGALTGGWGNQLNHSTQECHEGDILIREKLCRGHPEALKGSTGQREGGVGRGVNREEKEFSTEVSCGPGIVLAFQSSLEECRLCCVASEEGRCDQSQDGLTGMAEGALELLSWQVDGA